MIIWKIANTEIVDRTWSIIVLTAICGCRSVGTHESILKEQISGLDKLGNVMVITREDGSDTRSTFSQLTGFDEKIKKLVHQI